MKRISIPKDFSDDWITRKAGERMRNIILAATADGKKMEIDFAHTMIASTSFFDEGFAKLTQHGWTLQILHARVFLKDIHPKDKEILEEMFKNRHLTVAPHTT